MRKMGGQHQCIKIHQYLPPIACGGQHWCILIHQCQPPTFATSFALFHLFFKKKIISIPIFTRLFGGVSELHFLRILYAWKALDVQFLMVLASLNLELQSLIYHAQKEGDAKLKNSGSCFLKNSYLPIRNRYRQALLMKII